MSRFDDALDELGRGLAAPTSRRGFLSRLGAGAALALVPGAGSWGRTATGMTAQAPDLNRCYGQADVNLCFSAWRVKPDLSPYPELQATGGLVPMNYGPADGREAGIGYLRRRATPSPDASGRYRGPEVFLAPDPEQVFARQSTRNPTDAQPRPRRRAKGPRVGQTFMFGYAPGVTNRVGWVDYKYLEPLPHPADPHLCGPDSADFECSDYPTGASDGRAGGDCRNEVNTLGVGDVDTQFAGARFRVKDHISCESSGNEPNPIWEDFVSLRYAANSSAFANLVAGDTVEMLGSKDVGQSRCEPVTADGRAEVRWRCVRVLSSRTYVVGGRGWVSDDILRGASADYSSLERIG